jgi:ATP-dependent Clp protease ATP-binding subunit ClpA
VGKTAIVEGLAQRIVAVTAASLIAYVIHTPMCHFPLHFLAGVGKTAIVEGLAQRIVAGDVPPGLLGSQLLELDLAALAAGCMMPGEFEERLKAVCNEVADSPRKIILFIDDIHNLVPNAAQQVGTAGVVTSCRVAAARWLGPLLCCSQCYELQPAAS